jgi:hypothetical protein
MGNIIPPGLDPDIADLLATTKGLVNQIKMSNEIGGVRRPYFTEKWAKEVGVLMKHVYTTGEPRLIPVGDLSTSTIRNQWYQGKEYLLQFLDPDKSYAEMDTVVAAEYIKKRGLLVSPRKQRGILQHIAIVPWRPKFEEFLETAVEMQMFERVGLGLTEDDAKYVNETLYPLSDMFVWHIDIIHDHLKVVRVTQEKVQEVLNNNENNS